MDLPGLIKSIIDQLKAAKTGFEQATTLDRKKAQYNAFIDGIEKLHKVMKANQTSEAATSKLREIILSAATDAERMKEAIGAMPATAQNNGQNGAHNRAPEQGGTAKGGAPNGAPGPSDDKERNEFENALQGAIVSEKPNVKWSDVAGLENAKRALQEAIILPVKFPEIFVGLRKPWKGILLYGVC